MKCCHQFISNWSHAKQWSNGGCRSGSSGAQEGGAFFIAPPSEVRRKAMPQGVGSQQAVIPGLVFEGIFVVVVASTNGCPSRWTVGKS